MHSRSVPCNPTLTTPAAGWRNSAASRCIAAASHLLLAVAWLLKLAQLHSELLMVVVPAMLLAVSLGLLRDQPWARLAARVLNWAVLAIAGSVVAIQVGLGDFALKDVAELAVVYLNFAVSVFTLLWLGEFRTLAHFRTTHLLLLTAALAVSLAVAAAGDFGDKAVISVVCTWLQLAAFLQLVRSVSAFLKSGAIRNKTQALAHAIAISVLWVFPATTLAALTVGVPVFMVGWERGLQIAALTPMLLGFYAILGGWLAVPVLVAIGLWTGNAWWKWQGEMAAVNSAIATRTSRPTDVPTAMPWMVMGLVGLIIAAFATCLACLVLLAVT